MVEETLDILNIYIFLKIMVMVLILGMYIQYVPYYNPLICYMCTKKHKHIKRPKEVDHFRQ